MAEPQPSEIAEGVTEESTLPTNAEDRKAAAALSALDTREEPSADGGEKHVDTEALGQAMKNLAVGKERKGKTPVKDVPKVKVEAVDVTLLVDQLELSKLKATELLRQYGGDAVKAMTAYVTAAV